MPAHVDLSLPRKRLPGVILTAVLTVSASPLFANAQPKDSECPFEDYTNGAPESAKGNGLISWVDGEAWQNWDQERKKREDAINCYLREDRSQLVKKWGFRTKGRPQNPALAWKWFEEAPVGFGGVPYVLLKTILDLTPENCVQDGVDALCELQAIWHREPFLGAGPANLDHLGIGPHRREYVGGKARPPSERSWRLPYGLTFQSGPPSYDLNDSGPFGVLSLTRSASESQAIPPFIGKEAAEEVQLAAAAAWSEIQQQLQLSEPELNLPPELNLLMVTREAEAQAFRYLFGSAPTTEKTAALKATIQALARPTAVAAAETKTLDTDAAPLAPATPSWQQQVQLVEPLYLTKHYPRERPDHGARVAPQPPADAEAGRIGFEANYNGIAEDFETFGRPTYLDRVFFSCAACHVGRVMVDDEMRYLRGSPNTEIEAQYYSQLLLQTAELLARPTLDLGSQDPKKLIAGLRANKAAVTALLRALVAKVFTDPASFYGDAPEQELHAHLMVWRVLRAYPIVVRSLIETGARIHIVYNIIAANSGYSKPRLQAAGIIGEYGQLPDLMNHRPGQMDAFGIASGLVAVHALRPSYMRFLYQDYWVPEHPAPESGSVAEHPVLGEKPGSSPVFAGFKSMSGPLSLDLRARLASNPTLLREQAGLRVFAGFRQWAPPKPAPIDISGLSFSRDRMLANWDGNQGASARTLASGTSATGDPRKVNVEIHEPMNPFIEHLPPTPYPWDVDLDRAKTGRNLFIEHCARCHAPRDPELRKTIYSAATLGVDSARSETNTEVSRHMLAGLVLETCAIYREGNPGRPGTDFCLPRGDSQDAMLADYFADTPMRVREGDNGYKADMLHGLWTRAPYLHNGSVPTLGALLCAQARPASFFRGNVNYDNKMLGFEWASGPSERYSEHDVVLFKRFDTNVLARGNRGHYYGNELCPDLVERDDTGEGIRPLDPVQDRGAIAELIGESRAGDLLEYLKTL